MRAMIWCAALLALVLLMPVCLAADDVVDLVGDENYAVPLRLKGGVVLIGEEGVELTEGRSYISIESIAKGEYPSEEELFMARPAYDESNSGLELLMDSRGVELTGAEYEYLLQEDGLIRFQQGGLQGVMDRDLNVIVPCRYTMLVPNGEGGYLGIEGIPYDDVPDGVYYVDADGNESPTGALVLSGLGEFSEGLCTATSSQSGRVGYLDTLGNWAIPAQLEYGGLFRNDRAEACIESGYGVIDRAGNWLLTPKYTLVSTGFGDGNIIIASQDEQEVYLIDPDTYQPKKAYKGDQIYFGAYFDRNYVVLYTSDKVQLINEEGDVCLETGAVGNFDVSYQMGELVIMRSGIWGEENTALMNAETGDEIAGPYRDVALLTTDDLGEPYFVVSDFEIMEEEDDQGYTQISEVPYTRRSGTIDSDGQTAIPMGTFMNLEYAGHGLLRAETLYDVGLVDMQGNWIAKYERDDPALADMADTGD